MLTCAQFQDRIYDSDCRQALENRGLVPEDVAEHGEACPACRCSWLEAADDLRELPSLLMQPAPAALERRLRLELAERTSRVHAIDWWQGIAWAAIGSALALYAAGVFPVLQMFGAATWAFVGAASAFAISAARDAIDEALS